MFIGEYTYSIDDKKRIAVPPKFRQLFAKKNPIVTRGLDSSLWLFPHQEWEQLAQKLSAMPLAQADARGFARLMLTGAMEVPIDRLGRILVPDYLKKYASLHKKVVVTGMFNRAEIWDENVWNTYKTKAEKESGDIAERLKDLGI